jgi:hypothetical protein
VILDGIADLARCESLDPTIRHRDHRGIGVAESDGVAIALVALGDVEHDEVAKRRLRDQLVEVARSLVVCRLAQRGVLRGDVYDGPALRGDLTSRQGRQRQIRDPVPDGRLRQREPLRDLVERHPPLGPHLAGLVSEVRRVGHERMFACSQDGIRYRRAPPWRTSTLCWPSATTST